MYLFIHSCIYLVFGCSVFHEVGKGLVRCITDSASLAEIVSLLIVCMLMMHVDTIFVYIDRPEIISSSKYFAMHLKGL
jgi:hypothetical protein